MSEIIPFYRPPWLDHEIRETLKQRFDQILEDRIFHHGKNIKLFEERLRTELDVNHVITCGSGTIAILLAIQAVKLETWINRGFNIDRVALPAFTWKSTWDALHYNGCAPHYLDINPITWCVDTIPKEVEVVIPVHTFGNICEVDPENEKTRIIYDASHAWGAPIKEWGDITVFSLAPTKTLTTGEGGVLVTDDKGLADFISQYRDSLSRMSEFSAAVGLAHLEMFLPIKDIRKANWECYQREFRKRRAVVQNVPYGHSYSYFGVCLTPHALSQLKQQAAGKMEIRHYYNAPLTNENVPQTMSVASGIVQLPIWATGIAEEVLQEIL